MPDGIVVTLEADGAKIEAYLDGLRSKPIKVPVILEPAEKSSIGESAAIPGAADATNAAKAAFTSGIAPQQSGITTSTFSAIGSGLIGSTYSVPTWMMQSLADTATKQTIIQPPQIGAALRDPTLPPEKPMFGTELVEFAEQLRARRLAQQQQGESAAAVDPHKPIFSLHDLYQAGQLQSNVSPPGSPAPAVGPAVAALLTQKQTAPQATPVQQQAAAVQQAANQTNQQTTQQFANAVQQFIVAIQQYARPGGQVNPIPSPATPAGQGGTNRIGGLSAYGLARYVGLGLMAREALNLAQAEGDYSFAQRISNNQPGAMLQNELGLYGRVSGIPVLGQLASQLVDPLGVQRNQIAYDAESAQASETFRYGRLTTGIDANLAQGRASIAGLMGFQQSQKEAELHRDAETQRLTAFQASPEEQRKIQDEVDRRTVEINKYYEERRVRLQKELYQREFDKPGVEGRMFRQMSDAGRLEKIRPALEAGLTDLETQRQEQIGKESIGIRIDAEKPIRDRIDAANRELENSTKILQYEQQRQTFSYTFQANQLQYLMIPGGPTRQGLRENEMDRIKQETSDILKRTTDSRVADAFYASEVAKLDFSDFRFNRHVQRELFSLNSAADRIGVEGGVIASPLQPGKGIQNLPTRRIEEQILDIVNQTEAQRRSLIEQFGGNEAGNRGLLDANAREGRNRILALRNQLTDSQTAREINPLIQSTTGLGTFNQGIIDQELKRALQDVGNTSRSLPSDANPLGGNGSSTGAATGQAVSQIQQQSLQSLQIQQQIWNFLQQLQLQIA